MKIQFSLLLFLNLILINTYDLYAQKNIEEVEEVISEIRLYYNKINAAIDEDQKKIAEDGLGYFRKEITSTYDVAPGQGSNISKIKKFYPHTSYENENDTLLIKTERTSAIGLVFNEEERLFYKTSSRKQLSGTKLNSKSKYGLVFYYSKEENPGGVYEYRAYFSDNKLIKLKMNFQSDYDDIKNEKTYYDEFDKIIDRNTLPELYKIVQELKKKNEELYNKKEVEEIVSEIRKVYKHRKKNLDCSSIDTYPCKTEYSHSYLAPGCGIGHDKITWFVDYESEGNKEITSFITTSSQACSNTFNKEYLYLLPHENIENLKYLNYESEDLRSNDNLLFYYEKEGLDSEIRAYYYKGQLIKVVFEENEHYYPFENFNDWDLQSLKNLKIPSRPNP